MAASSATTETPKRPWLQFRLRTIFVVMAIIAILLTPIGWLRLEIGKRQAMGRVIRAVRGRGGHVSFDLRENPFDHWLATNFKTPRVDVFRIDAYSAPRPVDDALLAQIGTLTTLQYLRVGRNAQITDAGLAHLGRLHHLKWLWLTHSPITDEGLAHLTGLSELKFLLVLSPKVTDAGVQKLKTSLPACDIWCLSGRSPPRE